MIPSAAGSLSSSGHSFLSPSGVEIVFVLVGVAVLGSAVLSVTTKQLVHAALWLVVALGGLAVEFLLLTAEFIAWVQVLIYIGSIVVLVLFGLMLTKAPIGSSPDADSENRPVALGVAGAAAATLVTLVVDAFRTTWLGLDAGAGSSRVTGEFLFRHWVLPFEALSVLLLAALVGAIVIARSDRDRATGNGGRGRPPRPRPGKLTTARKAVAPKTAASETTASETTASETTASESAPKTAAPRTAAPSAADPATPTQEG